jgi:hypothetical protein
MEAGIAQHATAHFARSVSSLLRNETLMQSAA